MAYPEDRPLILKSWQTSLRVHCNATFQQQYFRSEFVIQNQVAGFRFAVPFYEQRKGNRIRLPTAPIDYNEDLCFDRKKKKAQHVALFFLFIFLHQNNGTARWWRLMKSPVIVWTLPKVEIFPLHVSSYLSHSCFWLTNTDQDTPV